MVCDGGYFAASVLNSFPDLMERISFLNKFYQCLLCHQLPHKVRKLVVVGPCDSGKSSWANVLMALVPLSKVAILTKEQNFGTSMIEEDTQLLYVDEWCKPMMSQDQVLLTYQNSYIHASDYYEYKRRTTIKIALISYVLVSSLVTIFLFFSFLYIQVKTILQGGLFAQSKKHQTPRMQTMNSGVFMTCNRLPDFGEEQENIRRRLAIYETRALVSTSPEAPEWMRRNAMGCLTWAINQINSHTDLLDPEERFYELPNDVSASAFIEDGVPREEIAKIKAATIKDLDIVPSRKATDCKYNCFVFYLFFFFFCFLLIICY